MSTGQTVRARVQFITGVTLFAADQRRRTPHLLHVIRLKVMMQFIIILIRLVAC